MPNSPRIPQLADIILSVGSGPDVVTHHMDGTVSLKNTVVEATAAGQDGRYRIPGHDDMEISISANILKSGNMEGFEDFALTLDGKDAIYLTGCGIGLKNDIVETRVKGENYPIRDYGHTDAEITIDAVALISDTLVPGVYTVDHEYHNVLATAVETKVEVAVAATATYCSVAFNGIVSEITNDAKDGDYTGMKYSLVPNGDITVVSIASDDDYVATLVGAYIAKTFLTVSGSTSTYSFTGDFIVTEIPFDGKDGSFNGAKFTLMPTRDCTITPFDFTVVGP